MLDAKSLAEIALEARNCFLEEDAPEFLEILRKGIEDLKQILTKSKNPNNLYDLYKELRRAAHSIKGGAGMAEMLLVSKLAHKIEDLFEALQQDRVEDLDTTLGLLVLGVEELDNLVELEKNSCLLDTHSAEELIIALDEFLQALKPKDERAEIGFADASFIKTALESDLSHCIQRVKEIIKNAELATPKNVNSSLCTLLDECELLGQALNCNWLVEITQLIKQVKPERDHHILEFCQEAIALIEKNKELYLTEQNPKIPQYSDYFQKILLTDTQNHNEQIIEEKPKEKLPESQPKFNLEKPPLPSNNRNLRVPIYKVNKMGDLTGQLLIFYEQLSLCENQIKQTSFNLKKRTKLLAPLKEQLENIYDQFSIKEKAENREQNSHDSQIDIEHLTEFDSLEFDEYSQIHNTLQSLTELIIQIQEIREDFDLVNREFQETLIDMRKCLNSLDQELREVRLVPFINLAGSFAKPLEKLNKDYHKSVELIIEGEQVLIDQNIIEALRTPLNHIIRNAFDHGIEMPEQREKQGKPNPAQIKLSAKLEGNNVILTITDDGQGIDIQKVFNQAKILGLFSQNSDFNQLREEILNTIFSPGFSTASQVSDLSGRGMGMDIVKAEIEKLRGTIEVKTEIGKGTIFQLKIPMALNIISLLLVKISSQTVAIPSENVLRVIRLSDYEIKNNRISWEGEEIPFYYLSQILPYNSPNLSLDMGQPYAGLLLQVAGEKVIMAVDAVIDEKPLVSKSLDDTVATPSYLGGCTILGSGTVVPIFVPDYFKSLLRERETKRQLKQMEKETLTFKSDELSIMIIDDSVAVRGTLHRILTQMGYNVTQCRDGREAWNTLQSTSEHFDLAICDLEMPGFDGYKVLQLIRASDVWKNLPVIILTSRDNDLHRQKAMDLGANAYLTKPFNPLKIIELVKNYS